MSRWVHHSVDVRRWIAVTKVAANLRNKFTAGGVKGGASGHQEGEKKKPSWAQSRDQYMRQRLLYQSESLRTAVCEVIAGRR